MRLSTLFILPNISTLYDNNSFAWVSHPMFQVNLRQKQCCSEKKPKISVAWKFLDPIHNRVTAKSVQLGAV